MFTQYKRRGHSDEATPNITGLLSPISHLQQTVPYRDIRLQQSLNCIRQIQQTNHFRNRKAIHKDNSAVISFADDIIQRINPCTALIDILYGVLDDNQLVAKFLHAICRTLPKYSKRDLLALFDQSDLSTVRSLIILASRDPSTISNYCGYAKNFVAWIHSHYKNVSTISAITAEHIAAYLIYTCQRGVLGQSAQQYLNGIKFLFQYRKNNICTDPIITGAVQTLRKLFSTPATKKTPLHGWEINQWSESQDMESLVNVRNALIVKMIWLGSFRAAEVCAIQWQDIKGDFIDTHNSNSTRQNT